jgi:hypothetical protein
MKTWEKPTLIVLVRGKPEETILSLCKHDPYQGGTGSQAEFGGCLVDDLDGGCNSCSQTAES